MKKGSRSMPSLKGAAWTVGLAFLAYGLLKVDALGIRTKVVDKIFTTSA